MSGQRNEHFVPHTADINNDAGQLRVNEFSSNPCDHPMPLPGGGDAPFDPPFPACQYLSQRVNALFSHSLGKRAASQASARQICVQQIETSPPKVNSFLPRAELSGVRLASWPRSRGFVRGAVVGREGSTWIHCCPVEGCGQRPFLSCCGMRNAASSRKKREEPHFCDLGNFG
jgi:hypothetical protein